MKALRIFICVSLLLILSSCSTSMWLGKDYSAPKPPEQIQAPDFTENIYERTKTLSTSANEIDIDNDMLKFLSTRMKESSEEHLLELSEIHSIAEKLDIVVKKNDINIDKIKNNVKPLVDIAYQLNYLNTYIKQIEKQNNKIIEENRNLREVVGELTDKIYTLKSDEQEWYSKLWIAIAILGVIIIFMGVVMVKSMPKTGMAHIGGGILLISLALFAQKYAWLVAIFGGVGLLASIGIFIYMVFIHKKALRENVHATEKLKNNAWEDVKEDIQKIHSKTTQELFGREKINLKKKGIL